MYERFYQLRNRPFALSPDPDFLYPSRVHREALDYLRFGIEGHAGFVVVTGEIGSGKTTLLQVLLRSLDGQTTVIRIVNTLLTGAELLESMLLDLGVEVISDEQAGDGARAGAAAHIESARTAGVSSRSSTKRRTCRSGRSKNCACSPISRRRNQSSFRSCSSGSPTSGHRSICRRSSSSGNE